MENKKPSISLIKSQAKKLKKEKRISYTQALDEIARSYHFSNWIDCQRSLSQQNTETIKVDAAKPGPQLIRLSFTDWLKKHSERDSPLGDLATDMLRDKSWPLYDSLEKYLVYLESRLASDGALDALTRAWRSYKAHIRRFNSSKPRKSYPKKPKPPGEDQRRVTYVKNAKFVPYENRSVEQFSVGDKAWISFDGSKALPVTITDVDDHYYSFRVERPLNKASGGYYLRLDEVRSTPELACMNQA